MNRPADPARTSTSERPVVLVVDDQPENLRALEAMLRRDDWDLVLARSAREAQEQLARRNVAVALLDVQMPEMDGYELAEHVRGEERTRHLPIIFIAGNSREPQRVFSGYETGPVDFLYRPIDAHVVRSKVDAFVCVARRRHAQQSHEERFRDLLQTASQAVWRLSPADARVLEDSPSWRALTGMSVEQWLEHGPLEGVHPDDRERVLQAWQDGLRSRTPWDIEYRVHRPDGRYTWTLARAEPVRDERGELLEWIGANIDIHARKEADSFRDMVLGILGHDLRNPLNAMMVSAQLALMRAREEPVRTPLERVLASGERMGRHIEQLLDLTLARLGGGIAVHPAPADLREVVEQALEEITVGKQRIRLDAVGELKGAWDVDRLLQMILTLVHNAVDHGTPGTPIVIRLDGEAPASVELTVHNLGPVVPESVRSSVFEPARRTDPARRHGARGLGLGLFISKQVVLAHGGTIAFESSEAGGNLLRVRLPRYFA
ncbi:PAS domain-containing protein [Nannocystis radixulma]|uniref:histidine kinase n=1 Tax=Nannocystis radixulma TaxID=2995305 RepID=A0ABT5B5F1_9BACT|nr:PAS domain-containing protein [Nannocystis radixulma]MDC0669339.1 PAS domain-containing protein [Nannocystis radixulma]